MRCKMIFDTYSFKKTLYYNQTVIAQYDISYPVFHNLQHSFVINTYYKNLAERIYANNRRKTYFNAVKQYNAFVKYNTFIPFEIKNNFDVAFLNSYFISMFFDVYYSKGADGQSMFRTSQTWDIKTGKTLSLNQIFASNKNWKSILISRFDAQVCLFEKEMGVSCFKDWQDILIYSMMKDRYYITAEGLVVYCPQGSIASDLWGIPAFWIPFSEISDITDKKFIQSLQ